MEWQADLCIHLSGWSLPMPSVALDHLHYLPQVVQLLLDYACSQGRSWAECLHRVVAGLVGTAGWTVGKSLWWCLAGNPSCAPLGGGPVVSRLWGLQDMRPGLIGRSMACSVSLPFISSHFWTKTGQSLLQLTSPSIPQDMHLGHDPGVQLAILCQPAQVPHVSCISLQL